MIKINRLIVAFLILFVVSVFFESSQSAVNASYDAGVYPVEISNTFIGDTRTTRGFAWYTNENVYGTYIQIVETSKFTGFPSTFARNIRGATQKISTSVGTRISHKVRVSGLKPGTSYTYRLGNGKDIWSNPSAIVTSSKDPAAFTFIHVTDTQGVSLSNYNLWKDTINAAKKKYPRFKFIAHSGDVVDYGSDEGQWSNFFTAGESFLKKLPFVPAAGNHDMLNGGIANMKSHFCLPTKTAAKTDITGVYSFDYGYAHIAVLNTQTDGSDIKAQAEWIKADMAATNKIWKIVLLHRGLYGSLYNTTDIRNAWESTFDEAGVNVVLQGHDHSYVRTYQLKGGKSVAKGCTYITSGSAGVKFYGITARPWQAVNLKLNQQIYTALTVRKASISFNAYTKSNVLLDSATITK